MLWIRIAWWDDSKKIDVIKKYISTTFKIIDWLNAKCGEFNSSFRSICNMLRMQVDVLCKLQSNQIYILKVIFMRAELILINIFGWSERNLTRNTVI